MLIQHSQRQELTGKELIHACKKNDALMSVGHNKLDEQFLQECRHLKAISLMSAGNDSRVSLFQAFRRKTHFG